MNDINYHLNNIHRNYLNLINLGAFLEQKLYQDYKTYLTNKYDNYIQSYKELFNPSKQIKDDMVYFADVRSLVKYNEDIVSGWLVEDFFMYIFNLSVFKEHNFIFRIDSHDSDRIIKKERTYINSDPDFVVQHNSIEFKLEIQSLLIPYNKFHIKKNKADRLSNLTSFLYSLLLVNKEIIFFYPDDIKINGTLTKIKAFGGKDGYEYIINNLPRNKRISNNNLDKKLLISLYWFYFYKKLGKEEFYKFRDNIIKDYTDLDKLILRLKQEE